MQGQLLHREQESKEESKEKKETISEQEEVLQEVMIRYIQ